MASFNIKKVNMYSDYELNLEELKISYLLNKIIIAYDIEPSLVDNPEAYYSDSIEEISIKLLEFGLKRLNDEKAYSRILSINDVIIKSYWIKFYDDFNEKVIRNYFIVGNQEMINNYTLDWILKFKNEFFTLYEFMKIKGIA